MVKKTVAFGAVGILTAAILYAVFFQQSAKKSDEHWDVENFDFYPSANGQRIQHTFYTLSYREAFEQAEWVAYKLEANQLSTTYRKRPYFIYDPAVKTKSANYTNYKNSGYTKGHLCPAADRKFSTEAFNETFYTSNISPQTLAFNAGIWNRLEQKVRYWVQRDQLLYVITGGVLRDDLPTIGPEKVAVPRYFYKILLRETKAKPEAIAFLIPHKKSDQPLYTYVVSIDKIEALTGIDFFPALADETENFIEASTTYTTWNF